jgi:hypothetical protein
MYGWIWKRQIKFLLFLKEKFGRAEQSISRRLA